MRPKRIILIVDPDQDRAGELAFVLRVHGFATRVTKTAAEVHIQHCELLVAFQPEDKEAIQRLRDRLGCRALMLHSSRATPGEIWSHGWPDMSIPISVPIASLLTEIQILSARKRGPKKPPRSQTMPPVEARASS